MLSKRMARTAQTAAQTLVAFRIVVERPVAGVAYSLQSKADEPLDPKTSRGGEPLVFDFPVHIAPGPKVSGDQVRREGPDRRFVYIRIGQLAGDASSPWSRRMKIDIHDIAGALLDRAAKSGGIVETRVVGTGPDGTPACATVPGARRVVDAGAAAAG